MPIDRKPFTSPVSETECPPWLCPDCSKGHLLLVKDSLQDLATAASRRAKDDPDWYPDWLHGRFTAAVKCSNAECGTPGFVLGASSQEQDVGTDGEPYWYTYYAPIFVYPAPPLFQVPHKCPKAVAERLQQAFTLFWHDPAACVARFRSAIELLLDERGVKRETVNAKKKKVRLTLHQRIETFCAGKAKFKDLASTMLAAKWLGNEGAHDLEVKRDDALDACDLVHYILDEVVDERTAFVKKLSKQINKAKGPRKRPDLKINWAELGF